MNIVITLLISVNYFLNALTLITLVELPWRVCPTVHTLVEVLLYAH